MGIKIEILDPKPGMTVEEAADYVNGATTPQERQARKRAVYHVIYSSPTRRMVSNTPNLQTIKKGSPEAAQVVAAFRREFFGTHWVRLPPDDSEGGNP